MSSDGTVLVRRRSLGDVVLLGAVTACVPSPVTVVTDERYVEVAARLIGVDRVVPWGSRVGPGKVVDLQRSLETVRAFPLARRVRKHSVSRRWFGRPAVTALYARACGVAPRPTPWILGGGGDRLALIPGASTPIKQWSADRFVRLGMSAGLDVVVLGSAQEHALVHEIAARIPGAVAVARDGFAEAIDALSTCRVAVGGDTGLLHLAAALGVRPVALFGPTHPRDGFFPYPDGVALGLALPCRPCALHRVDACRVGHHGCMGHDVATVRAAVVRCAG